MSDFQRLSLPRRPVRQEADIEAQQQRRDLAVIGQTQDLLQGAMGIGGQIWQGIAARNRERQEMLRQAAAAGQRIEQETALRGALAQEWAGRFDEDWSIDEALQRVESIGAELATGVLDPQEQVRFQQTRSRQVGSFVERLYGHAEETALRETTVSFMHALDSAEEAGDVDGIGQLYQDMVDARVADPAVLAPGGDRDFRQARARVQNIADAEGHEAALRFIEDDSEIRRQMSRAQRAELRAIFDAKAKDQAIIEEEERRARLDGQWRGVYDNFTARGLIPPRGSAAELLPDLPSEDLIQLEEKWAAQRARLAREAETGEKEEDPRERLQVRQFGDFMAKVYNPAQYPDMRLLRTEAGLLHAGGVLTDGQLTTVLGMTPERRGQLRRYAPEIGDGTERNAGLLGQFRDRLIQFSAGGEGRFERNDGTTTTAEAIYGRIYSRALDAITNGLPGPDGTAVYPTASDGIALEGEVPGGLQELLEQWAWEEIDQLGDRMKRSGFGGAMFGSRKRTVEKIMTPFASADSEAEGIGVIAPPPVTPGARAGLALAAQVMDDPEMVTEYESLLDSGYTEDAANLLAANLPLELPVSGESMDERGARYERNVARLNLWGGEGLLAGADYDEESDAWLVLFQGSPAWRPVGVPIR